MTAAMLTTLGGLTKRVPLMITFKREGMTMYKYGMMAALATVTSVTPTALADMSNGVGQDAFANATVEMFNNEYEYTNYFDFGNGMTHTNLFDDLDHIGYTGGYGMGDAPSIEGGYGGSGGYFGTGATPTSFELTFENGISRFGFYGAESDVGEPGGRDGILNLEFYSVEGDLLGQIDEETPSNIHAWLQWHGFQSDGDLISRVVFNGVGHMVMDNVSFSIPAPGALALFALASLGFRRRRS